MDYLLILLDYTALTVVDPFVFDYEPSVDDGIVKYSYLYLRRAIDLLLILDILDKTLTLV